MIRGFFFDLDGTIVDTDQANFLAYQRALQDIGISLELDDFNRTIGLSSKVRLPIFAPGLQPADYDAIYDRKTDYYRELLHHTVPNHDLLEFIKDIKPACQVVLVTTGSKTYIEALFGHHKLGGVFDHIVAREDVKELKPHPEAYQRALQLTALQPREAVAFEDSKTGIAAAKAAGIAVVTVKDFWR